MKNAIWIILILAAVGGVGYWYYRKQKASAAPKPAVPAGAAPAELTNAK